jgi:hypothetical protein
MFLSPRIMSTSLKVNLASRTIFGFIWLILVLGILLMAPAFSLSLTFVL